MAAYLDDFESAEELGIRHSFRVSTDQPGHWPIPLTAPPRNLSPQSRRGRQAPVRKANNTVLVCRVVMSGQRCEASTGRSACALAGLGPGEPAPHVLSCVDATDTGERACTPTHNNCSDHGWLCKTQASFSEAQST